MPPEMELATPHNSAPDPTTQIFVQLGVLQEGMRNALGGIDEIKSTLTSHSDRIGAGETKVAILETRVNTLEAAQKESEEDAKPVKGRWPNWIAAAAAVITIGFFILDRFYLSSH